MKRLALSVALFSTAFAAPPADVKSLFSQNKVWTIHLTLSAEQYAALEPKNEGRPGGPGFGPGGPGPRPGMGGPGMGPAGFLAPAFLQADSNKDQRLSHAEFTALASSWFSRWDTNRAGKLSAADLRAGLLSTFVPPGGPGEMGPGGPGEMGPGGGGMPRMSENFEWVHANLDFDGASMQNIAVRYKGNNSYMTAQGSVKKSLKLDFNRYVKGQKLVGLTKLNLHNNITDDGYMNETLSYRLFRDAGLPTPRTAYAKVYVTVPGKYNRQYFGLYGIVEDVDKHFLEDQLQVDGGALFKPTGQLFANLGDDWARYEARYDAKNDISSTAKQRVIDFSRLLNSADDRTFAASAPAYLDLDNCARFFAVTVLLTNLDSILAMHQNYYLYLHPKTNQFQFFPWDLDHSFGQFPMFGTGEQREKLDIDHPWSGSNKFLERLFALPAFQKAYRAHLTEFREKLFVPQRLAAQVDETAAALRAAVKEESAAKLARFEKIASGATLAPSFPGPPGMDEMPGPPPMAMESVPTIKPFVAARARSISEQLAGKSKGLRLTQGRGPGGPGGGPMGGGPGAMLERPFLQALDANHDNSLTREEFLAGFEKWFQAWGGASGSLTTEQINQGISRDLLPFGPRRGPQQ